MTSIEASPHSLDLSRTRALVFDHLYDGVIVTTPDGVITDWNAGAERMFGWSRDEVIGLTPAILHRPQEAPVLTDSINAAAVRHGRWVGEITFVRKDGTLGRCQTVTVPLVDDDGRVGLTVGVNREITSRPAVEETLASERLLLRTLLDAIPDPIFFKDRQGRHLIMNEANRRLFGFSEEDIGKTAFELPLDPEHAALYAAMDEAVMSSGQPIINREEPFTSIDGRSGWFLTSKFPLRNAAGRITGLIGIAHDITALKEATEEMARMRQRLADHVDNSPLAVVEWGPEGHVERWMGQAEQIFGWTAAEALGKTANELGIVHPDDLPAVRNVTRELLEGDVRHNVSRNRNISKTGRTLHCVWNNSVLRDSTGRAVSILSLAADVTERVTAETAARDAEAARATIERKLLETQKLESLGLLAGGIAHDFNNLLTGILGHTSLMLAELPAGSPDRDHATHIETIATRAADLCKQMLAYSGKGRFAVERVDLNDLVEDTARLLAVSISKKAALDFRLHRPIPELLADATQLRQVIMNLVINASESLGDHGGTIELASSLIHADRAYFTGAVLSPDLPEGDYVCLEVIDNGCGMESEVQARIFDPFFTTKFTGRGLGLAAVHGIVRSHGGALRVESTVGRGTTFRLLFPCAPGVRTRTGAPTVAPPTWHPGGRVLVVDDEPIVRRITARLLESLGFEVLLAADGIEAGNVFEREHGNFTFVMLDLTMPRLDGEETFHALHRLHPDTRVFLMSGFDETEAMTRFAGLGLAGFIQKPFTLGVLREKVKQVLA
jgi:PAS domain S-box-containing protein